MDRSSNAAKLVLAAVALVVGLALGGLAPRGEVRSLRAEVAALQSRDCSGGGGILGQQIAEAFRGRPAGIAPAPAPAADAVPELAPEAMKTDEGKGDDDGSGFRIDFGEDRGDAGSDETFEQVADAMALRQAQSRAALAEGGATDAQLDQVDTIVGDMNGDLAALADGFVGSVQDGGGEPDRRDAMTFARDSIDVMLEAEDAIWGTFDEGQRDDVDPQALDPFSYIDGEVVEVLMELDAP